MITCPKFRPHEKNTLRGFADLELPRGGIHLQGLSWAGKDGKGWVFFPGRALEERRKANVAAAVEFAEGAKEARNQFQQQALDAIHAVAGMRKNPDTAKPKQ